MTTPTNRFLSEGSLRLFGETDDAWLQRRVSIIDQLLESRRRNFGRGLMRRDSGATGLMETLEISYDNTVTNTTANVTSMAIERATSGSAYSTEALEAAYELEDAQRNALVLSGDIQTIIEDVDVAFSALQAANMIRRSETI